MSALWHKSQAFNLGYSTLSKVINVKYEELAKTVVRDSLKVDSSDVVTITTWDHTIDVANALALECFKLGADAMLSLWTDQYYYGLLTELSEESLRGPSRICQAFTEAETATINMFGPKNPEGLKKMSSSKANAWGEGEKEAHYPRNIERRIRNVGLPLALLTPERAKVYNLSLESWRKATDKALTADLKEIAETGLYVAEGLEKAHEGHLTAPNGTNLTFELGKRLVHIDDGLIDEKDIANKSLDANLPAGSVLTTLVETSANGKVIFDQPLHMMGREIQGIEWLFKDGRAVSMKAKKNEELISDQFNKASGDRDKISFLQIGLNPKAVYGYLTDYNVAGAVQIGIGDNEYIGGKNASSYGMAATLSKATLVVDGNAIIKNGQLQLKSSSS
jgi:leucyl aminopeptidase (aminopeptidase T)